MSTNGRLLFAFALTLTPLVLAAPAKAAGTYFHTWVSNIGTDNATCGNPTTPCATFNGAYNNTVVGGEITCLNGGNYLALLITNSITIDCQYSIASNEDTGSWSSGIAINAPAGSVVTLRGLDVDLDQHDFPCPTTGGPSSGAGAINFTGGGVLHLQKMKVNHFTASDCSGVYFAPTSTATLDITDSDITDNGLNGTTAGITIVPASGVASNVTINRSQIQGNYFGIVADGRAGGIIKGTISDSVVSGNSEDGIAAISSGSRVWFLVDQTEISGNTFGLAAGGSGTEILVSTSSVFNNTTGLHTSTGGALYSYGNNRVNGNATNGAFTGTIGLQ